MSSVTQALEIVPDSGHLELFDPARFSQFSRALPAELPIKVPRGAAVRHWQWLSSLSDSTESSLTWKGKRGPRSDLDVIFYDRIKDLNQMLLLKRCSTSSRKKIEPASSIHISKEILENLRELRGKQQELFRLVEKYVTEWETLNMIQEDWLSCPNHSLPLEERSFLHRTHHPHQKKSSFLLDKWPQSALQQISRREEIFKR